MILEVASFIFACVLLGTSVAIWWYFYNRMTGDKQFDRGLRQANELRELVECGLMRAAVGLQLIQLLDNPTRRTTDYVQMKIDEANDR